MIGYAADANRAVIDGYHGALGLGGRDHVVAQHTPDVVRWMLAASFDWALTAVEGRSRDVTVRLAGALGDAPQNDDRRRPAVPAPRPCDEVLTAHGENADPVDTGHLHHPHPQPG